MASMDDQAARDKAAKFVELANRRVNKVIKDIRLVGNLANKRNYDYTEDQARKIVRALQKEVDAIKAAFTGADEGGGDSFKL